MIRGILVPGGIGDTILVVKAASELAEGTGSIAVGWRWRSVAVWAAASIGMGVVGGDLTILAGLTGLGLGLGMA